MAGTHVPRGTCGPKPRRRARQRAPRAYPAVGVAHGHGPRHTRVDAGSMAPQAGGRPRRRARASLRPGGQRRERLCRGDGRGRRDGPLLSRAARLRRGLRGGGRPRRAGDLSAAPAVPRRRHHRRADRAGDRGGAERPARARLHGPRQGRSRRATASRGQPDSTPCRRPSGAGRADARPDPSARGTFHARGHGGPRRGAPQRHPRPRHLHDRCAPHARLHAGGAGRHRTGHRHR